MEPRIGVIGCDGKIPEKLQKISEKIGEDIAKNNSILICGGRGGVMEAVCRGAKRFGGTTIGILPSLDKEDANPCVDIPITTGIGQARNALVISCSDVVIVVNGRVGTLSELGLALSYGKPVVVVENTGGVADLTKKKLEGIAVNQEIRHAKVDNAVKIALNLATRSSD